MDTLLPPSAGVSASGTKRKPVRPTATVPYQPRKSSGFAIIEQAQQGVLTGAVDALANLLNLSFRDMAAVLQVAERTLHRLRHEGQLDRQTSERLLLLENLAAHGLLVFDGRADALADWLRYPLPELKNQPPLQLLTTISGFTLVDDVLTRIEYGVYS